MRLLFILFIIIPIIEMILLIKIGSVIGVIPTVALVMLTAVIGITLLRQQGLDTLARLQSRLAEGEVPGTELLEGAMLLIGGALLLTPGFFTDSIGFICLIPVFRRPIAQQLIRQGILRSPGFTSQSGSEHSYRKFDDNAYTTNHDRQPGQNTIEGEFRNED